jgi:hypothetical protein
METTAVAAAKPKRDNRLPRHPGFEATSLAELRTMRNGLTKEEGNVSYWRRILQARVDLMRKRTDGKQVSIPQLAGILTEAQSSHRRVAALSIEPSDGLEPLPNLAEVWTRSVPAEGPERQNLLDALFEAEHALSQYRHELHRRIDLATAELIARYRDNPDLALTALRESLPLVDAH